MEIIYNYTVGEKVKTTQPIGLGKIISRRPANDNPLYPVYEIAWKSKEKDYNSHIMLFNEACIFKKE